MDEFHKKLLASCQANKGRYSCVIFLDIDGVLNDFDDRSEQRVPVREDMVARLQKIVAVSGGDIILTSSWRICYHTIQTGVPTPVRDHFQLLLRLFDQYGLTIAGTTEEIGFDKDSRPLEIRQWLTERPDVERFVILDDMDWHWGWLSDHVVCTRRKDSSAISGWRSGLDSENVRDALKILHVLPKI